MHSVRLVHNQGLLHAGDNAWYDGAELSWVQDMCTVLSLFT